MIGRTVGRYRVVSRLGAGGMGVVYLAEDTELGRRVALKFLPPSGILDPHALERFKVEARAASGLNHPCICTIYDIGEVDSAPYIVMEALDGEPLNVRATGRAMKIDDLLDIGVQLADALDAAHGHGIVHRDVKPANIFLDARNRAKLLDFGLAKLTQNAPPAVTGLDTTSRSLRRGDHDERLTEPGTAMGTVSYMSPEQARGEDVDARTDLFSLGAVLYEMATGQRAFHGTTVAVTYDAILNRTPPPVSRLNPMLPDRLEGVIAKALEKNADLRYQHASEMRADLRRVQRDLDLLSGTQRRLDSVYLGAAEVRPVTAASRVPWKSLAAVLVLAVAATAAWVLLPASGGETAAGDTPPVSASTEPPATGVTTPTTDAPAQTTEATPAQGVVASATVPGPPEAAPASRERQPPVASPAAPPPAPTGEAQTAGRESAAETGPPVAEPPPPPAVSSEPPATPETVARVETPPPPASAGPAPAPAEAPPAPAVSVAPAAASPPPPVGTPETPPPVAEPPAELARVVESNRTRILAVLRDYERAIETRDIALYRAVVPGLTASEERTLLDTFRNVEQQVDIRVDDLEVEGDTATARLVRQVVVQTRDGPQAVTSTPTFRFERSARGWVITDTSAE